MIETTRMEQKRIYYKKPTKFQWLGRIIWDIVSLNFFINILNLLAFYIVNYSIGRKKATIGKTTRVQSTAIFRMAERITIGEHCMIGHHDCLQAGKAWGTITIGDYCQLGPNDHLYAYNHAYDDITKPCISQGYYDGNIVLEDDVTLGGNVVILANVTIGKGSIVSAGSVVNKNVPPYAIVAGVFAKVVGFRFSPEEVEEFQKTIPEEKRINIDEYRKSYQKLFINRIGEIKKALN